MVFRSYDLFPHLSVLGNIMLPPVKVQKRKKGRQKNFLDVRGRNGLENSSMCLRLRTFSRRWIDMAKL